MTPIGAQLGIEKETWLSKRDPERRLAAILSADAVGYSRLMAEDEAGTIQTLNAFREAIETLVEQHRGRVVDSPGDNLLAEFPNALDAVQCAVEIQGVLRVRNQSLAENRRMLFRIGLHLGDIRIEGDHIYGDGVNIAARLEGLAQPGGVCVSGEVQRQVENKLDLSFEDLGEQEVKNIPNPVRAYRINLESVSKPVAPKLQPTVRYWARAAGVIILLVALALAVAYFAVDKFVGLEEAKPAEIAAEQFPASEPVARDKSIAVLPFANISPDPEDAYFADGIHDEVLAQLSKIRDLKVISRTSVMRYRQEDRPPLPEIAGALGVANILEGSVRLAENRVRITTQLIEAESDAHLWTETYDREFTAANIFSIQSEIATTVADALRATLSPEEQDRLATVPTKNLAAYEAYILGKQRMAKLTSAALAEAVDYFQQAIDLDPKFALAYVGLADGYVWQSIYGGLTPVEILEKAQAAADKALELDDRSGEAYASIGSIKQERGDRDGAEKAYRRALQLSPNYIAALDWYGQFLLQEGQADEALRFHRKAAELDPLSATNLENIGRDLSHMDRSEEALLWFKKALEVDPGYAVGYSSIADHYHFALGRLDEAFIWAAKGASLDRGDPLAPAFLGWLFLDLGDLDRAESWINRSLELGPEGNWPNFSLGLLHLYRNDEAALGYGRRALKKPPFDNWVALNLVRDHELGEGRYAEARALYEKANPELLNEGDPKVIGRNLGAAIDLALVLTKTGEQERADLLLDRSLEEIQTISRLGASGYWIADVLIHALKGDKEKALSTLREAIDEGWRSLWWYFLKRSPNLESLHDEPEFQAMVAEIEADMAAQLARVREMERNGELVLIPAEPTAPSDHASGSSPMDLQ
jgi:adenylate cyclase